MPAAGTASTHTRNHIYAASDDSLLLCSQSQAHEEVRFLLYRLDFTEFYKRSTAAGDGDSDSGDEGDGADDCSPQRDEGVDGMMVD